MHNYAQLCTIMQFGPIVNYAQLCTIMHVHNSPPLHIPIPLPHLALNMQSRFKCNPQSGCIVGYCRTQAIPMQAGEGVQCCQPDTRAAPSTPSVQGIHPGGHHWVHPPGDSHCALMLCSDSPCPDAFPRPLTTMQRMRDTKQVMQTQGHVNHKMSQELPVGMHVQFCSDTGSVCHFFWWEYLTLKSCTCSTGQSGGNTSKRLAGMYMPKGGGGAGVGRSLGQRSTCWGGGGAVTTECRRWA